MTGTIRLESQEITVDETDGVARIAFVRSGDLSGPVTINYGITNDTATRGSDYGGAASGSITIPAGQGRVVLSVPIVNDGASELTESFVLSIINIDSGTLFAPRTVRVDIVDDDNPVTPPAVPPLVSDHDVSTTTVIEGLDQPISFEFSPIDSSIVYIAEKGGRIRVFDTDTNSFKADFIDLSNEVNSNSDRGLLDVALHPNFPDEPYVYAFYVVDPPETATAEGRAAADMHGNRFAHVVRFEADPATNYQTVLPDSKVILVGGAGQSLSDISGGGATDSTSNFSLPASDVNPDGSYRDDYIKVDSRSHAGGALEFGPDGALYISIGDGASFGAVDKRAISVQSIDALAGKILRVDPMTGDGLPDNPFVDPGDSLDTNRSKVFQLGLRNPFSMSFDREGKLIVTETGWNTFEEINIGGAGANFGWPFYEGGDNGVLAKTKGYQDLPQAAAFYAAVASGDIDITPAFRAFAHANAAPGYQVQAIVGASDIIRGGRYPSDLDNDYVFVDASQGEVYAIDADNRNEVKFLLKREGFAPVSLKLGPDGYLYYADLAGGAIGRFNIGTPSDNLFVNGDFETDRITGSGASETFANGRVLGWRNIADSGVKLTKEDGDQSLNLDATAARDSVFQDVKTTAGTTYTLSFDAKGAFAGTSDIDVIWNNAVIGTVSPTAVGQTYQFSVTGTGKTDRLHLREVGSQNDGRGATIDNVSLEEGQPGLLLNGSFENVSGGIPSQPSLRILKNGQLPGWTSSTNKIEVRNDGYKGSDPTDGRNVVEIDAGNGTLSQTVKTTAGQSYDITFDYGGRPNYISSSKVEVVWNGQVIGTIAPTDTTMRSYTLQATGTGGNDKLSFRSVSGDRDLYGGYLDDVDVAPAPPAPPSLLKNGSFESAGSAPSAPSYRILKNGDLGAWVSSTNKFEVRNDGHNGTTPTDGRNVVEIDAGNGTLSQAVKTTAGSAYEITFDYGGRANYIGSSKMEVLWNNQVVGTISPTDTSMRTYTLEVTGTGGNDQLSFRSLAGDKDLYGGYLDDVAVEVLPARPPNLLSNGSFETIAGPSPTKPSKIILENGELGAWRSSTNKFEVRNDGHHGSAPTDGRNVVEIDASTGTLSQSVKTTSGESYDISFDLAGRANHLASSKVEVLWNNKVVGTITPTDTAMRSYHIEVTGTGGDDQLSFRSPAGDTDLYGAYLDDVSIVPTSEHAHA